MNFVIHKFKTHENVLPDTYKVAKTSTYKVAKTSTS